MTAAVLVRSSIQDDEPSRVFKETGRSGPEDCAAHLEISAKFAACLTLAHVTAGVELWGPGGWSVDREWKDALVRDATLRIAKLEQDTGIKADVFIGSGDVPKILSQVVKQTNADLLVTGCYPYGGNLRTHGYGIICAVPVLVLSV
jgi:nucleotide-binding universal stress UspA family protein